MLIAEELLLLLLDDAQGTTPWDAVLDSALAAALLAELTLDGAIEATEDGLVAGERIPNHPLLSEARTQIAGDPGYGVSRWRLRFERQWGPLRARVASDLVGRGVLSEQRRRVLGLAVGATHYPEADPATEQSLRLRLRRTGEPDPHDAALLRLASIFGLETSAAVVDPAVEDVCADLESALDATRRAANEAAASLARSQTSSGSAH